MMDRNDFTLIWRDQNYWKSYEPIDEVLWLIQINKVYLPNTNICQNVWLD